MSHRRLNPTATRAALVLLALAGAALRLPGLGRVHLHPDEAAYAADARALAAAPGLVFEHEAAGWVAGTYVWLAAPLLATPLSTGFAARLPAAVAGLLLIAGGYLLGRHLGRDDRVGLLAALALTTAPWAVHHARLALGPSLIAPLVALGCWALLTSVGPEPPAAARPGRALLGVVALTLATLTYAPARLVVPPLATLCVCLPPGPRSPRWAWATLTPLWLVFLLLLPYTLAGRGAVHLRDVLAWIPDDAWTANLYRLGRGYALHFSSRHLFSGASSRGFAPEGYGLLPLWQAPLLLTGLLTLLRRADRTSLLLGLWLLLHPLAAAFTRDVPNAIRAGVGLPAWGVLAGLGGVALLDALRVRLPQALRGALVLAGGLLVLAWTAWQGWSYHTRYPIVESRFYYAGRRETVEAVSRASGPGAVLFPGPFWQAYLRLEAAGHPLRRDADGWVLGEGPVHARVLHRDPGDAELDARPGDRELVPGQSLLRPLD